MNAKARALCTVCILIFHTCYTVDLDYYADNSEDPSQSETEDIEEARRFGNEDSPDGDKVTTMSLIDLLKQSSQSHSIDESDETSDSEVNNSVIYENVSSPVYEDPQPAMRQYPLIKIFDDYEYHYKDDDDNNAAIMVTTDIESTTDTPEIVISNEETVDNVSRPMGQSVRLTNKHATSDLYHLEPAVKKIRIMKYSKPPPSIPDKNTMDEVDDGTWYVPETYPCWELPIVYGRLKERAKLSDVFVLKGGQLSSVKLASEEEVAPLTNRHSVVDTGNKWCDQGPCYGDHTLCVFANDTISNICDRKYKVKKLSVSKQEAVVNTINSMRHHVAIGQGEVYRHLPTASNMQQIMYDVDLATISSRWLRQCIPGPAPCSSIDDRLVTQLECKKSMHSCCKNPKDSACLPRDECFVPAVIGCLHAWFLSAGKELTKEDIACGHITPKTFHTVQILWANTDKIGCAYGTTARGDIRVVCNFSPGATFYVSTKFYCGIIPHKDITGHFEETSNIDITSLDFMSRLGINMNETNLLSPTNWRKAGIANYFQESPTQWGVGFLSKHLKPYLRDYQEDDSNGSIGAIARLVTKYTFLDEFGTRCDTDEPIYMSGPPGSECAETGRVFKVLCYSYRDPYPGYRLTAIVAPVALFALILYDLFSGVLRQTNY